MKKLQPLDFYLLRIPSLSLKEMFLINELVKEDKLSDKNRVLLKNLFSNSYFEKAIFLASRSLYDSYKKWLNSSIYDIKLEQRLIKSLYKYYIRMSTRSTPYGLFAGFSFGNISTESSCITLTEDYLLPQIDFDMRLLTAINDFILKSNTKHKNACIYYSNNTIYRFLDKYRYIDYNLNNYQKKHFLTEIEYSDFLEYVLGLAKNGVSLKYLIDHLKNNVEGADKDMLYEYVENLINLKILTNEEFDITSIVNPTNQLIKKLKTQNILLPILENQKLSVEKIIKIEEKLKRDYRLNFDQLLMVNLKINTKENNLNKKVVEEISTYVEDLMQLQIRTTPKELLDFKKKFVEQYDSQEKPLKEVMDFDLGIGYGTQTSENIIPTPLLNGITYFQTNFDNKERVDNRFFKFINNKLNNSKTQNSIVIEILDEDLIALKSEELQVNDHVESSYIMGTLLASSFSDLDDGNFFFLSKNNLPSPYMGSLMSRFASYDEKFRNKIRTHLNDIIEDNQEEEILYAEIVYNPGGKISNVILRPNFYNYHIEYGSSTKNMDSISTGLSVDDLYVSVQNNRIVLRSKKLNKEIIPRLTSAHNFSIEGLPLFRFLCDLQFQKVNTGFNWDWEVFKFCDFLPRVVYKKIILTPAQWNLKKNDFEKINSKLIEIAKISRYCYIADGDNELVLDIENTFCKDLIKEEVKNRDVILYEYLISPQNGIIKNNSIESYSSEVIIPFKNYKRVSFDYSKEMNVRIDNLDIKRKYYPGEDWIYYKIYLTHGIAEEILVKCLTNFFNDTVQNEEIFSWFFIRYEDPKHHLRIRLKNRNTTIDKITKKLNNVCKEYIESGIINDISIHTYEREVERYAYNYIEFSEILFYNDSNAIINILEYMNTKDEDHLRYKIALINVNLLMNDFKLSIKDKYELVNMLSLNFLNEFIDWNKKEETTKLLNRSLKTKFREEKEFLNEAIFLNDYSKDLIKYVDILKERSNTNKKIIDQLDLSSEEKFDFIASHIHMSLNRLFNTKQRVYEMVVYNLLKEIYNSILRRNVKK